MADQIIGEIIIGANTKLIFTISEWRGRFFANVRKFIYGQKYEGPTKSGLVLNKNLLRELNINLIALEKSLPHQNEHEYKHIPKSDTEYIKITTIPADNDDLPAVDVREFVDTPGYQGPTKRGIRFKWNLLPDVLACFRKQLKVIVEGELHEPTLFGTGFFADPIEEQPEQNKDTHENSITNILGEGIKSFPISFLNERACIGTQINLPDNPLRLEQDNTGCYYLSTDENTFCTVRNPTEANFIIYAQMQGCTQVIVPQNMIDVFKIVKAYENYARMVQKKLVMKIMKKVGQRSVADYEARKKMSEVGFPWLNEE